MVRDIEPLFYFPLSLSSRIFLTIQKKSINLYYKLNSKEKVIRGIQDEMPTVSIGEEAEGYDTKSFDLCLVEHEGKRRYKMNKNSVLAWVLALSILLWSGSLLAQCPQDTVDSGTCDTLHVGFYDPWQTQPPPWDVHIPILVTHDLPDLGLDSIQGFVIPLKITDSNPAAYCSIPPAKNLAGFDDTASSVFRHFGGRENRMMTLFEEGTGAEWDTRILDIRNEDTVSYFLLSLASSGSADRRWWEGSRTLLATITLLIEDVMTVCLDSCLWPPVSHLAFGRGDGKSYIPRHLMPICQNVFTPTPPFFTSCPVEDQRHGTNGHFISGEFEAWGQYDEIVYCDAEFVGYGVENVTIHYHDLMHPPSNIVKGHVEYDVVNHYLTGGYISIGVMDTDGEWAYCSFNIILFGRGDCNGDGAIDLGDVLYLVSYLYKGGPAPDPMEAGDVDYSGGIDLGDVLFLVSYLYKGGPAPAPPPTGILLDYDGCKVFQKGNAVDGAPPDQDCIEYQYDGSGILLLKHLNAGFNCCPDEILADITIEDNNIIIEENESLESGGCFCLCLFDVDYQIGNLPPGEYTIKVNGLYLEEGDEILQFTVDLASSPSGSFCVYRDHYPWGI